MTCLTSNIFRWFWVPALLLTLHTHGQSSTDTDTTVQSTVHSPQKAALYSAVLPGSGQIYNRKFWKLPIVYGGIGASTFFIIRNHQNYRQYRNEYLYRINNGVNGDEELSIYSDANLLTLQDQYRRWRDLSVVVLFAVYVLQIVDATVDAHLMQFDVSDNLSLRFNPRLEWNRTTLTPSMGITLKF